MQNSKDAWVRVLKVILSIDKNVQVPMVQNMIRNYKKMYGGSDHKWLELELKIITRRLK